ncbi:MAG: hypothetical protein ACFB6R_05450 [Alphaproteobacteria bacterium]
MNTEETSQTRFEGAGAAVAQRASSATKDAARPYRLVWFQHFHKAGGSSLIELAKASGETFYPQNANANPLDAHGKTIPLWQFHEEALTAFVDSCEAKGVTFVATEWGVPDFRVLANDPRVVSVTCLRDPFSRIMSCYRFDMHYAFTPAVSIFDYFDDHSLAFRQRDYYVNGLAAGTGSSHVAGPRGLALAKENLAAIDHIVVLEGEHPFRRLADALGWLVDVSPKTNVRRTPARMFARAIYRRSCSALNNAIWLNITYRLRDLEAFKSHFANVNHRDAELFVHARELAARPLAKAPYGRGMDEDQSAQYGLAR